MTASLSWHNSGYSGFLDWSLQVWKETRTQWGNLNWNLCGREMPGLPRQWRLERMRLDAHFYSLLVAYCLSYNLKDSQIWHLEDSIGCTLLSLVVLCLTQKKVRKVSLGNDWMHVVSLLVACCTINAIWASTFNTLHWLQKKVPRSILRMWLDARWATLLLSLVLHFLACCGSQKKCGEETQQCQ